MRRLILYSFIVIISSSCTDTVLKEKPKDFISSENYYQNADQIEQALSAAYSGRWSDNYKNYLALHTGYGTPAGSFTALRNWEGHFTSDARARSDGIWEGFYETINKANIIISKAPSVEDMNKDIRDRILAEARFLRSYAYFQLLKYWGPVPLRTEPYSSTSEVGTPRATEDKMYNFLIDDLSFAEKNALEDVGNNTGRATRWAAKMLLANVYLDKENWSKAAAKAEEIIESNNHSLVSVNKPDDFYNIFGTKTTSSEEIMAYHFSNDIRPNFMQWYLGAGTPYNRGNVWGFTNYARTSAALIRNWNENDLRKEFNLFSRYIDDDGNTIDLKGVESTRFKKYIKDPNGLALYNIPIYRVAEAYLIYAEASDMANGQPTDLGLKRLNIIKRRGYGYDPYSPSPVDYQSGMNRDEFRDAVIKERGYEYFLEERRWWDLKRTGKAKETISEATGKQVIDARLLWPIPVREIDSNPAISQEDQNPGY